MYEWSVDDHSICGCCYFIDMYARWVARHELYFESTNLARILFCKSQTDKYVTELEYRTIMQVQR